MDKNKSVLVFIISVGECQSDKSDEFWKSAHEKAARLSSNINSQHVSSWQTRDDDMRYYGGAIVAGEFILSFSGLPELANEAAMLHLGQSCGWLCKEKALAIAKISSNPYFTE